MVVWLFAGGGESEIQGLVPFLRKNFPECEFERYTPVAPKKGPKPGKPIHALGKTGKNLSKQIKYQLSNALRYGSCDCILVIDDLDCRDVEKQNRAFSEAIDCVPGGKGMNRVIGFASPEIESWLIADWDHTFAKHSDFRGYHERLRYVLSHEFSVAFDDPESFSEYDGTKDACKEKLSETIVRGIEYLGSNSNVPAVPYKKGIHTPVLLINAQADKIAEKCKLFGVIFTYLTQNPMP